MAETVSAVRDTSREDRSAEREETGGRPVGSAGGLHDSLARRGRAWGLRGSNPATLALGHTLGRCVTALPCRVRFRPRCGGTLARGRRTLTHPIRSCFGLSCKKHLRALELVTNTLEPLVRRLKQAICFRPKPLCLGNRVACVLLCHLPTSARVVCRSLQLAPKLRDQPIILHEGKFAPFRGRSVMSERSSGRRPPREPGRGADPLRPGRVRLRTSRRRRDLPRVSSRS